MWISSSALSEDYSDASLIAKFGFDTAESEPLKVSRKSGIPKPEIALVVLAESGTSTSTDVRFLGWGRRRSVEPPEKPPD